MTSKAKDCWAQVMDISATINALKTGATSRTYRGRVVTQADLKGLLRESFDLVQRASKQDELLNRWCDMCLGRREFSNRRDFHLDELRAIEQTGLDGERDGQPVLRAALIRRWGHDIVDGRMARVDLDLAVAQCPWSLEIPPRLLVHGASDGHRVTHCGAGTLGVVDYDGYFIEIFDPALPRREHRQ